MYSVLDNRLIQITDRALIVSRFISLSLQIVDRVPLSKEFFQSARNIYINTLLDNALGIKKVFVLVESKSCELYEGNFSEDKLVKRLSFDGVHNIMLDGPTIVSKDNRFNSVIKLFRGSQESCSVDLSKLFSKPMCINKFWAFNWCSDSVLVMTSLTSLGQYKWSILIINKDGAPSQDTEYVPHEYGQFATCIEHVEHLSMNLSSGQCSVKHRFFVATSFRQVVIFEDGQLIYCASMGIFPIKMAVLENSDECISLAVLSDEGTCIALKLSENKLKECASWDNISTILLGDFAGLCHDQLLAIKKDEGFVLTDLSSFSTEEMESNEMSATEGSSLRDTVKAFKLKQQEAVVQLTSLQSELQRKRCLTITSLNYISSCRFNKPCTQTLDPDLLCVVPGNLPDKKFVPEVNKFCVLHMWKRFEQLQGVLVVGLVIKNISKRIMSSVHCSLLLPCVDEQTFINSTSRIVWASSQAQVGSSSLTELSSPAKRRKILETICSEPVKLDTLEPEQSLCVVCSMTISSWKHSELLSGAIAVCAKPTGQGIYTLDVSVSVSPKEALSQELMVELSCTELWKGDKLIAGVNLDWTSRQLQDLAALLGTRRITKVEISTKFTSLDHLVTTLKRMLLEPHSLIHHSATAYSGEDSYSGSLSGVIMKLLSSSQHSACISVMTKSDAQHSLVLSGLRTFLPCDATITN